MGINNKTTAIRYVFRYFINFVFGTSSNPKERIVIDIIELSGGYKSLMIERGFPSYAEISYFSFLYHFWNEYRLKQNLQAQTRVLLLIVVMHAEE